MGNKICSPCARNEDEPPFVITSYDGHLTKNKILLTEKAVV